MESYRLLRVTNFYPEYLEYFYGKYPNIRFESYEKHYLKIMGDSSDPNSYMSDELGKLGADSRVIISNAESLQNSWCKENDFKHVNKLKTILRQIQSYNPDILWIDEAKMLDTAYISQIRSETPGLKLVIAGYCTHYSCERIRQFQALDFMFTCTPGFQHDFSTKGIKTYLVYFAFETSILDKIARQNPFDETDVLFTGSLLTGRGNHNMRIEYLESILRENIPLTIFGNLESKNRLWLKKNFHRFMKFCYENNLNFLINKIPFLHRNKDFATNPVTSYSSTLRKASNQPVFGIEMFNLISRSAISLNQHAEIAGDFAGNIRLFEATGVGSCLITDYKKNLPELFELEKELVTYKSKQECIDKIKFLLNNPEKRNEIAKAGQLRTLKDHTIEKRAKQIHHIFLEELKNKKA